MKSGVTLGRILIYPGVDLWGSFSATETSKINRRQNKISKISFLSKIPSENEENTTEINDRQDACNLRSYIFIK